MALDQLGGDPEQLDLGLVRVGDDAAGTYSEAPGGSAQPRRQQARRARLGERRSVRRRAAAAATCSSIVVPSRLKTKRPWRSDEPARPAPRAAAPRPVAVADVDLELAPAQAGRDLERREVGLVARSRAASCAISDSGMPNMRTVWLTYGLGAREHRARPASVASAAGHIACSSRGGPGRTITVGPPSTGTTRPGRGPGRVDRARAARAPSPAFGSPRAAPRGRSASAGRTRRGSAAIFSSIPSSRTSSRPAKRATTSAVRSSAVGPSPPLVTIRSAALGGQEPQRRLEVLGAVADDEDVGDLDPQLAEPLARSRGRCGR